MRAPVSPSVFTGPLAWSTGNASQSRPTNTLPETLDTEGFEELEWLSLPGGGDGIATSMEELLQLADRPNRCS